MNTKIEVSESENGREARYDVVTRYGYPVHELTEVEAEALHKEVAEAAGKSYTGTEHASVWHYAGSICWAARNRNAAEEIYKLALSLTAAKSALIQAEKRSIKCDRLMVRLLDGSYKQIFTRNAKGQLQKLDLE